MTKTELLRRIEESWDTLQLAIAALGEAQLTGPRSADGWTVKDNLAHLAAWERSALAIVRGQPRYAALGVDAATYAQADFEKINALIQAAHRDQPAAEVLAGLRATHQELLAALEPLTDADLARPDTDFLPGERGFPLDDRIVSNTYEHYEEHLGWFRALLADH